MNMKIWNPWHGCTKLSEGCLNCYVYRGDAKRGIDSSVISKTKSFDLPISKKRDGSYRVPSGTTLGCCFTTDLFVEGADDMRIEFWDMVRKRDDLHFFAITKRIERFMVNLPSDWGEGYSNFTLGCTVENNKRALQRLPVLLSMPIKRKMIICEPLLGPIDIAQFMAKDIVQVVAGGESGPGARECKYEWITSLRQACIDAGCSFWFKQTGANFIKDGRAYKIPRAKQHSQAREAGLNIKVLLK